MNHSIHLKSWSSFRVAKRAYCKLEIAEIKNNNVVLVASHDGYSKQAPKTVHKRQLECNHNNVVITDTLSKKVEACFHLHVHPDVVLKKKSDVLVEFFVGSECVCILESTLALDIIDTTWHPQFGKSITNKKIKIPFSCLLKTTIHLNFQSSMKILVLSFYYQPDLCAGSFRTTALIRELKKYTDLEIDILTTMPNRYASFGVEALEEEIHDNVNNSSYYTSFT